MINERNDKFQIELRRWFSATTLILVLLSSCTRAYYVNGAYQNPSDPDEATNDSQSFSDGRINSENDSVRPQGDGIANNDSALPKGDGIATTVGPACEVLSKVAFTYASNMVVCDASPIVITQCLAEKARCNAANGWHMCTASEFLARGGATKSSPVDAWIKSCMKNNGPEFNPSDNNCTSCNHQYGMSAAEIYRACTGGGSGGSGSYYISVKATKTCNRLGPSSTSAVTGYWQYENSDLELGAAVCCQ